MRTVLRPSLARAEDGVSTIEFAAVATFLCLLLMGVFDFGLAFWEQMELANAASGGADYVMANGYTSSDAVSSAVTSATNLSGVTPNSTPVCGCPTSTGVKSVSGTYPTCGTSCSGVTGGSGTSVPYVTVTASVSYSTLFSWPGISSPVTLTATAIGSN
jgi:Flp pilus assembly protein TadG